MNNEKAVSEVIGAIILIGIFAVLAAVVIFSLETGPTADVTEPAIILTSEYYYADHTLVLSHDGGDPIERADVVIRVDGIDQTSQFVNDSNTTDWTEWKAGEKLYAPGGRPESVQVIGTNTGYGDVLLYSSGQIGPIPTVTTVPVPTPTGNVTPNPPVVNFTGMPLIGQAPLTVQFTDFTTNTPTSWLWNFGDGATSTAQNPQHTYWYAGNYSVTLRAENGGGNDTLTKTEYITSLPYVIRVNTGGPQYTDGNGNVWLADQAYNGSWGYMARGGIGTTTSPISGTVDDPLYQSETWYNGNLEYRFSNVPDGIYNVTLKFAEIYSGCFGNGLRVFDLQVENATPQVTGFDIYSLVGGNAAYDISFNVTVADGELNIFFLQDVENPKISAIEISTQWYNGTPPGPVPPTGAIGIWEIDEGVGTTIFDSSGNSLTGTLLGSPLWINCTRPLLWFDAGREITVTVPDNPLLNPADELSFAAWAYPVSHATTKIAQKGDWDGHGLGQDVWQGWNARVALANSTQISAEWGEGRPELNQWYFLTATYDGSVLSLYVDGILKATTTGPGTLSQNSRVFSIGSDADTQKWFNGSITHVSFYNYSLTAGEVTDLYTAFTPVGCPPVVDFTANVTSGAAPLAVQFNDTSTRLPYAWFWDFGDGENATVRNPVHTYTTAGNYTVSLRATNIFGNVTETKTGFINVTSVGAGPVGYWRFEDVTGAIARDSSGHDNDGSILGTYVQVPGVSGNGLYFDGTDTYVSIPDNSTLDFTTAMTLTAWVYPVEKTTGDVYNQYMHFIAGKGTDGNENFDLSMAPVALPYGGSSYTGKSFWFESQGGSLIARGPSDGWPEVPPEQWSMLALVIDGSTLTYYLDGTPFVTTVTSPLIPNNNPLYLGRQNLASYPLYFRGVMDEVSLYGDALSQAEITTLYHSITPSTHPPVAAFSANVTSGTAPLSVLFTDATTNSPMSWSWIFGDGGTSTDQNPVHTYTAAGNYTVTLTATNVYGSDNETKTEYINVSSAGPTLHDVILNGRTYTLGDGGTFGFDVTGSYSYLTYRGGSRTLNLPVGSTVAIVLEGSQTGSIGTTATTITSMTLSSADVYIDGSRMVNDRDISGIWVSGYDSFTSDVVLTAPNSGSSSQFTVDGVVIYDWWPIETPGIILNDVQPDSNGILNLNGGNYVIAGVTSYSTF